MARRSTARPPAGLLALLAVLGALGLGACSDDEPGAEQAATVCTAIGEIIDLDREVAALLEDEWGPSIVAIEAAIEEENTQFEVIVAADAGEVSRAARDVRAFNLALAEAGAFTTGSAEEFGALVVDVNGSAEAGAGKAALEAYATDTCTE